MPSPLGSVTDTFLTGQHNSGRSTGFTPGAGCILVVGITPLLVARPVQYCIVSTQQVNATVGITPIGGNAPTRTDAVSFKGQ